MIREARFIKAQRQMGGHGESSAEARTELVTRVFTRFRLPLLRYLRELLTRREDAEDVAQETYVRLVRAGTALQSEMHIRASMFRAATNLAYDRFRQWQTHGRQDAAALVDLPDEAPHAERVVAIEQALRVVERTLLTLAPRCRQVFLLRTFHEWDYETIAERLGISKRTVEREMQTALDACQRELRGGELP